MDCDSEKGSGMWGDGAVEIFICISGLNGCWKKIKRYTTLTFL